jgi:hypothetical protein
MLCLKCSFLKCGVNHRAAAVMSVKHAVENPSSAEGKEESHSPFQGFQSPRESATYLKCTAAQVSLSAHASTDMPWEPAPEMLNPAAAPAQARAASTEALAQVVRALHDSRLDVAAAVDSCLAAEQRPRQAPGHVQHAGTAATAQAKRGQRDEGQERQVEQQQHEPGEAVGASSDAEAAAPDAVCMVSSSLAVSKRAPADASPVEHIRHGAPGGPSETAWHSAAAAETKKAPKVVSLLAQARAPSIFPHSCLSLPLFELPMFAGSVCAAIVCQDGPRMDLRATKKMAR